MPLMDPSYEQQAQEEMWDTIAANENRETRFPADSSGPLNRRLPRLLKCRYPGQCAQCGGSITRGTTAEWHPNGKFLVCLRCSS